MEILSENSNLPQGVSLILGFFDGIHAGHVDVIKNTPNAQKIIVTFSTSPSEYFGKKFKYIYSREYNYKLINDLGVDFIYEQKFSNIVNLTAEEYIDFLLKRFNPKSITTGFNHTFGSNRKGTPEMLVGNKNFDYFCTMPTKIDDKIVSSSYIKELLNKGFIKQANKFLTRNFSIKSTVISGKKLGTKLGFPTANMEYPDNIVRLPYGVYSVIVHDMPAVMNWGVKPTIGSKEVLEVHIPNINVDLYGKELKIEILSKIRDEKKFNNLDELKFQIERDVKECLKLS